MKIVPRSCILIITLDYQPEMRFTPNGHRVVSVKARGLSRVYFQLWENTLEDGPLLDKFADLPADTLVEVWGDSKKTVIVVNGQSRDLLHECVKFTIKGWKAIT